MGGNFFVDTYQIVLLAMAAGRPPFITLGFSCSTLIAGLLDNGKNIKVSLFPLRQWEKKTVITC